MTACRRILRAQSWDWNNVLCRSYSSTSRWKELQGLSDGDLTTFRREAFTPSLPALLPRGHFNELPALRKWFGPSKIHEKGQSLAYDYFDKYATAAVPLELTRLNVKTSGGDMEVSFQRTNAPLYVFLEWTKLATTGMVDRLYLAQASFAQLPKPLSQDLPTPEIVAGAGTGDIYDTNLWLGMAPTYTPLHRDPNPNLFVQLAGHKVVRMLSPKAGDNAFDRMQKILGERRNAVFRGDEMMNGKEKQLLEDEIWNKPCERSEKGDEAYEAHVWAGDGLFIPKGWWHSIKGVDGGIIGSVNWWFR